MPLSKARDKERARERRKLAKRASNLTRQGVQPKTDALQSKSKPLKSLMNRTASSSVIPNLPNCPDGRYRDADGNVATYVKPKSLIVKPNIVQPKLPFYAGAGDHFGEVKSHYYAEQFFSNLFQGVS